MHMLCTFYVLYIALNGSGLVLVSCVLCPKQCIDIAMVEQHGVAVSGPRVKASCTLVHMCLFFDAFIAEDVCCIKLRRSMGRGFFIAVALAQRHRELARLLKNGGLAP